ncbi:hypothetical protein PRUPE_1G584400 [Prunus persica]|uniref:Uncharacterized protein n=1 Tax=Prunus persica TaxID=3760 RepID=M5XTT4_PRUPE|nr:hypothetical protein PRUPE_1G584400 [Prunus persica]
MPFFRILPSFYFLIGFAASNHPLNRRKRQRISNQHKRSRRVGSCSVIKNYRKGKMKSNEPSSTLPEPSSTLPGILSQDLSVLGEWKSQVKSFSSG